MIINKRINDGSTTDGLNQRLLHVQMVSVTNLIAKESLTQMFISDSALV